MSDIQPARPLVDPTDQLFQAFVDLAGMADDASDVQGLLARIVVLTAHLVDPVRYASVTAYRYGAPTTVAMSHELVLAIDEAQYVDKDGPCLEALRTGRFVSVPRAAMTTDWPGFREAAADLGLAGSLSIPLFTASGAPAAALNLYASEDDALRALAARLERVEHGLSPEDGSPELDPGSEQLVRGVWGALKARVIIQQAVEVLIEGNRCSAEEAYLKLRIRAAQLGTSVTDVANALTT